MLFTYTGGKHPSAWHTSRQEWSSSWEVHGCVCRVRGTGYRRRRSRRGRLWRQRGSRPCRATSSTTACGREPASSSGSTCNLRAAAATCRSSTARTQPALRQNHQREDRGRRLRSQRLNFYSRQTKRNHNQQPNHVIQLNCPIRLN